MGFLSAGFMSLRRRGKGLGRRLEKAGEAGGLVGAAAYLKLESRTSTWRA